MTYSCKSYIPRLSVIPEFKTVTFCSNAHAGPGCEKIFADKMSGAKADRPGLKEAFEFARKGDTIVVWRLDRLGRSLKDLMALVEGLEQRTIGFRSLQESIDTTSSGGKLIFHLFGALAEFERNLIRERTQAGLQAARTRGRRGGRQPKLTLQQIDIGRSLAADPKRSVSSICKHLDISRPTYYRYINPNTETRTSLLKKELE